MAGAYICTHSSQKEEHFGDRFAFTCNGCRELGYGSCYTCINNSCNYHLHTACQRASPKMSHPFFTQGHFVLDKTMLPPSNNNYNNEHHQVLANSCVACGTTVHGWRYVLTIDGAYTTVFLHPCCMMLPHMNLHTALETANCVHCLSTGVQNEGINCWAYANKKGVAVHVKCMKDMLHKDWERRYYAPEVGQHTPHRGYGGTTTRDRGLGNGGREGGRRRRRKRDYLWSGFTTLVSIVSIFDSFGVLGSLDLDSIKDALVDFAENIWGNSNNSH